MAIEIEKKHIKLSRSKVIVTDEAYKAAIEASKTVDEQKMRDVDEFRDAYLAAALEAGKQPLIDTLHGTGDATSCYNNATLVVSMGDNTSNVRVSAGTVRLKTERKADGESVQSTIDFLSKIALKRHKEQRAEAAAR